MVLKIFQWFLQFLKSLNICDPSLQNRALVADEKKKKQKQNKKKQKNKNKKTKQNKTKNKKKTNILSAERW